MRFPQRAPLVAAVLAVLVVALLTPAASAGADKYAPSIGTVAALTPSGSVTSTVFSVKASGACPAGTEFVNAYVDRPAAGWKSVPLIGSSTDVAGILTGIPLSDSIGQAASNAGAAITDGTYDFALICNPDFFGSPATAQFDATFTITGDRYVWNVPGQSTTTTTVTTSPAGGAAVGDTVRLTANVTPATAVGTIQFTDTVAGRSTPIGTPVAVSGGTASVTTAALTQGSHTIGATFAPGSAAFAASTAAGVAFTVTAVNQTLTTTSLAVSPAGPAEAGAVVTLTATITPAGATGTVLFTDSSTATEIGSAPVSGGTASIGTTSLPAGDRRLVATFTPDSAQFAGSASTVVPYRIDEAAQPQPGNGPPLGSLTVSTPPNASAGTSASPITLTTDKGCPAGSDLVAVTLYGPGGWANGVPAAATSAVSTTESFTGSVESVAATGARAGLTPVTGTYFYQLTCTEALSGNAFGYFLGRLWFYDTTHWLNADPAVVGIPTTTALEVAPPARTVAGVKVTLTARVSPALTGTVVFKNVDPSAPADLGKAALKDGVATFSSTKLGFGLYYLTATFEPPTTGTKYLTSTSPEVLHAVVKPAPPTPPKAASLTGKAKVGSTLTCGGIFRGATTTSFAWFRNGAGIAGATKATYQLVKADGGQVLSCRVSGTNAGGTTSRTSVAVRVAK